MHIIKLDATDSTNTYLKDQLQRKELDDFTTVVTHEQSKGKGQVGASWESEAGKNLTFSLLKKFSDLSVSDAFDLNICASLSVLQTLKKYSLPNLRVKWPNDILSGNTKICGILVENVVLGQQIGTSVIGIGLNVNQTSFHKVSNATSMKLLSGLTYNLDELLHIIVKELRNLFSMLEGKNFDSVRRVYHLELFRRDKPSTFRNHEGKLIMGFIRGISNEGKLRVELENNVLKDFALKEIQLLY